MRSKIRTAQLLSRVVGSIVVALIATLLVTGDKTVSASGVTGHTWIGGEATQYTVPVLQNLLESRQQQYYGQGLMFPDNLDSILGVFPLAEQAGLDPVFGHHASFLNNYLAWIRVLCGSDPDVFQGARWCGDLLAHYMGCVGHVVADYRFDRYWLMKVDELCGPNGPPPAHEPFNDFAGAEFGAILSGDWQKDPPQSQGFTDLWLDSVLSPLQNPAWRPNSAWIPDVGCADPFQCSHPINNCALVDAVLATFPVLLDPPAGPPLCHPFLEYCCFEPNQPTDICVLQCAANIGQKAILLQDVAWALFANGVNNMCIGGWAVQNVQTDYGGMEDSGQVLGQYLNKTWGILQDGGTPVFEQSDCWTTAAATSLSVRSDEPDAWAFDYASWIEVAQDVAKFQLSARPGVDLDDRAINRIGVLLLDGTLYVHDGIFYRVGGGFFGLEPIESDIIDFQLEGERIAALDTSGDLMIKENLNAKWVTVAAGVSDFRLEDFRVAAVIAPPSGETDPTLLVKEGPLDASWGMRMTAPIDQFALDATRIGVLTAGELLVKEGTVDAPSVSVQGENGPIDAFQLAGDRVWILESGNLWVKEGPLSGGKFVPQLSGVSTFQVDRKITGALVNDELLIQDLSIYGGWSSRAVDADRFEVQQVVGGPGSYGGHGIFMHRSATTGHLFKGGSMDDQAAQAFGIQAQGPCIEGLPQEGLVSDFQLEGRMDLGQIFRSRVGVLVDDTLYVKQWYNWSNQYAQSSAGTCPADLDYDGSVGISDLLWLRWAWGTSPDGPPDLDGDGSVGIEDLMALLAHWGPCN